MHVNISVTVKTVGSISLFDGREVEESEGYIYFLNFSMCLFVCVEVLRPSQLSGVMSSAVSLPNHTFTGQA